MTATTLKPAKLRNGRYSMWYWDNGGDILTNERLSANIFRPDNGKGWVVRFFAGTHREAVWDEWMETMSEVRWFLAMVAAEYAQRWQDRDQQKNKNGWWSFRFLLEILARPAARMAFALLVDRDGMTDILSTDDQQADLAKARALFGKTTTQES